jgi:GxxExxY protein
VYFRGEVVGHYRMDLVVADRIVVECKTATKIDASHEAQLLNYLHATRMPLGFVLNFGPTPSFWRMVYDRDNPTRPGIDETW